MFPGPVVSTRTSQCGQPLSRLAEIAEVVSRQQQLPVVPIVPIVGMARSSTDDQDVRISEQSTFPHDHPGSVSAALRKRSPPPLADIVVKRFKTVEENEVDSDDESEDCSDDMKDVRFREYQAEIWSEKFEDLCEFRRQYGHCHVPHTFTDNAPLAQWVKRQRYQYKLRIEGKRSTLSDERVRLLNQIGFIWNSHDVVWEERWQELLMFKHLHGHCIVPSNYDKNPQLAIWVKRQRRQYKFWQDDKPSSMTPERIDKLNKLGFSWDCRKNNTGTKSVALVEYADVTANVFHASSSPPLPECPANLSFPSGGNMTRSDLSTHMKHNAISRQGGGFPLPKSPPPPPSSGTISALQEQLLRVTGRVIASPSVTNASTLCSRESSMETDSKSRIPSLENLPCEFFSFSRKFTKFPKINLSK